MSLSLNWRADAFSFTEAGSRLESICRRGRDNRPGVGIALSAEQIVEAQHWRHIVSEETDALDGEARLMWDAMSARVSQGPCIERRLAELGTVFKRHEAGLPIDLTGPIGRPRLWYSSKTALAIATADGALSHMSLETKQSYFAAYAAYDIFSSLGQEERASWRILQTLDQHSEFGDSDWRAARQAYNDALDSNATMKANLVMREKRVFNSPLANRKWLTPFFAFHAGP